MPYTLKPNKLFAKDPNGEGYLPQNVVTDQSTTEQVALINSTGAAQVSAIQAEGTQTLDSIPDDYTALQGEVNDLKSAFDRNGLTTGILEKNFTGSISGNSFTCDIPYSGVSGEKLACKPIAVSPNSVNKVIIYLMRSNGSYQSAGECAVGGVVNATANADFVTIRYYVLFTSALSTTVTVETETLLQYSVIDGIATNKKDIAVINQSLDSVVSYNRKAGFLVSNFTSNVAGNSMTCNIDYNGTSGDIITCKVNSVSAGTVNKIVIYLMRSNGSYQTAGEGAVGSEITVTANADYITIRYYVLFTAIVGETVNVYTETLLPDSLMNRMDSAETEIDRLSETIGSSYNELNGFNAFSRFCVVGDSLSCGYYTDSSDVGHMTDYAHSWPYYVEKLFGAKAYWAGYSGQNCKTWLEQTSGTWGLVYTQNLGEMPLYFLAMGANEEGITIGTISDINDDEPTTLYGYVGKTIRALKSISPDCFIIAVGVSRNQSASSTINPVYEAVCNAFNKCYYYDVQGILNTQMFTECIFSGHYSALGYNRMAKLYNWVVNKVMSENVADFLYINEADITTQPK